MLPIVITTESILHADEEIRVIAQLIDRFGCRVHLRKKSCSEEQVEYYCRELVQMTDRRLLTLHGFPQLVERYEIGGYHAADVAHYRALWGDDVIYSVSCHSMEEADKVEEWVSYLFLSPIFDSISKQGYKATFDHEKLKKWLSREHKTSVIALGGIDETNLKEVEEMGFKGVALLGAIWRGGELDSVLDRYLRLLSTVHHF